MGERFVQARHFRRGRSRNGRAVSVRVICVHSMEMPEKPDTAEGCAQYFARATRPASAHVCVDADSEVYCVHDGDTAFAAPGANADGWHIEHAGYAGQTIKQWTDPYSVRLLGRSARVAAKRARKFKIPPRWLTDAQLADGVSKGFTWHAQVSDVFKRSTHTDPGEHFPYATWMVMVHAEMDALAGKTWRRSRLVAGLGVLGAVLAGGVTQIPDTPAPRPKPTTGVTVSTRPGTPTTKATASTARPSRTTTAVPRVTITKTVTRTLPPRVVRVTTRVTSPSRRYVLIRAGDTLFAIADATKPKTTVAQLRRLNPGIRPDVLAVGSLLRVA